MNLNQEVSEETEITEIGSMIYTIGINIIINDLKWNSNEYVGGILTLKEINEQTNYKKIRVIQDDGLSGIIYEYGNYNDGKWRVYGITKGYA